MKKLLVYLRPYRLQAILAPCFKLLEAAFELLVPLIMADIIDVGISSGDTAYILKNVWFWSASACAALPAPPARSIFFQGCDRCDGPPAPCALCAHSVVVLCRT